MWLRFLGIMAGLGLIWGLGLPTMHYVTHSGCYSQAGRERTDRARILAVGRILKLELADVGGSAASLVANDPVGFWDQSTYGELIVRDLVAGGFLVGTTGVDGELQTIDDIFYYFPANESSMNLSED